MKTGGLSENKDVDESLIKILNLLDSKIKEKLSLNKDDLIESHLYKIQVVAGVIYYIKISCNNNYYHIKVISYLPHTKKEPELLNVIPSNEENEITYF